MNKQRKFIRRIAALLVICVLLTGVLYVARIIKYSDDWLNSYKNIRLSKARQCVVQGTIYDSSLRSLAWSSSVGDRQYCTDEAMRRALSQTVGDQHYQNSEGIEYRHATTLLGLDIYGVEYNLTKLLGNYRGNDIVLTLNAELTKYFMQQFPDGATGAGILINYKTGAILAKVSLPNYDPADMSEQLSNDEYKDKNLQTTYAPGSTFKIVVLASALENLPNITNEVFNCTGSWTHGNSVISCSSNTAHGQLSLSGAFAKSCNVVFASLAYEIGGDQLKTTAEQFGFNTKDSCSDLYIKASSCLENGLSSGEVIQAGIGQGTVEVTPVMMAMISGAIANGGQMMEPKIIRRVQSSEGQIISEMQSNVLRTIASESVCYTIANYMWNATSEGTAKSARIDGYSGSGYICGKTGTAEHSSDKNAATNAWYTGCIYGDDDYPYAIAIVVEDAGYGGSVAAPIAANVMKKAMELGLY